MKKIIILSTAVFFSSILFSCKPAAHCQAYSKVFKPKVDKTEKAI